ncbi:MAG: hypothetical protein NVS9B10_03040 [Nevskia sp.]
MKIVWVTGSQRQSARGFSLIELLIAVTLGLLLVAAVGSIYLSSSRSYRTQTGVSQVQEEGRFANFLVVPIVRNAGYLPNPLTQTDPTTYYFSNATTSKRAVYGLDNFIDASSPATPIAGFDRTKVVTGTDVLIVSYVGKNASAPIDSPLRTCLGNDIPDDSKMAVNVFYIRNDDTGTPGLYCSYQISDLASATSSGGSTSTQPIVSGVRDMQILYGMDTDNNFDADYYVAAGSVSDWTRVASIQIAFTIDSVDATERGSTAVSVSNGHITHTFNTTIQIRNRLHT